MAAAGLKATEAHVNRNLLSKDHSWRVVDYAFDILQYVKTVKLLDGSPL